MGAGAGGRLHVTAPEGDSTSPCLSLAFCGRGSGWYRARPLKCEDEWSCAEMLGEAPSHLVLPAVQGRKIRMNESRKAPFIPYRY